MMKTIAEFFKDLREPTPKWIKEYKNGDKPSFKEIVNSGRVVFYPGARYDGQPIKTFNIAHYAHIFFYVDYMTTKEEIKDILLRDNTIKGYKNIGIIEYQERELSPRGWTPHYNTDIQGYLETMREHGYNLDPYCLVFIFEREEEYDEEHGSDRFAVIYLKADGVATYDALFANNNKAPDIMILQDHGWGGNYTIFGGGGALNQVADATKCYPPFVMIADNTRPWDNYEKIPNLHHAYSGHLRWLYRRLNK